MSERAHLVPVRMTLIFWPGAANAANAKAEAETQMHNAAADEHTGAPREDVPLLWHLDGVRAVDAEAGAGA